MSLPRIFTAAPVAHRGLHDAAAGRPENGLSAVRAAVSAGYGVEIDVRLSADGEAMAFHDETLDRMTGERGPLDQRDAAELARIALAGGPDAIPPLPAILDAVGERVPLLVELKSAPETDPEPLASRIAALLASHPGPAAAMSFDPRAVAAVARAAPGVPRGLVARPAEDYAEDWALDAATAAALSRLEDFTAVGASFAAYDHHALPTERTAALRRAGAPVFGWTVRSAREAAAAAPHLDAIIFEGFSPAPAR